MKLYAAQWPDGSLVEEQDDCPTVFVSRKAAERYARMHFDDTGPRVRRARVVSANVEFK